MSKTMVQQWKRETVTMSAEDYNDAAFLDLLSVRGICTQHVLHANEDGDVLYYLVAPESGEINGLRRWARGPKEVTVWTRTATPPPDGSGWDLWKPYHEIAWNMQREAQQFVLDAAVEEVQDEQTT